MCGCGYGYVCAGVGMGTRVRVWAVGRVCVCGYGYVCACVSACRDEQVARTYYRGTTPVIDEAHPGRPLPASVKASNGSSG